MTLRQGLDILKRRGYTVSWLEKEFCKAIRKCISEFQKWSLPVDFTAWFKCIMDEYCDSQSALDVSMSSQPVSGQSALPVPMSFSQPVRGFDTRSGVLSHLSQP